MEEITDYQSNGKAIRKLAHTLLNKHECEILKAALKHFRATRSVPFLCTSLVQVINTPEKLLLLVEIGHMLPDIMRDDFDIICSINFRDLKTSKLNSPSGGKEKTFDNLGKSAEEAKQIDCVPNDGSANVINADTREQERHQDSTRHNESGNESNMNNIEMKDTSGISNHLLRPCDHDDGRKSPASVGTFRSEDVLNDYDDKPLDIIYEKGKFYENCQLVQGDTTGTSSTDIGELYSGKKIIKAKVNGSKDSGRRSVNSKMAARVQHGSRENLKKDKRSKTPNRSERERTPNKGDRTPKRSHRREHTPNKENLRISRSRDNLSGSHEHGKDQKGKVDAGKDAARAASVASYHLKSDNSHKSEKRSHTDIDEKCSSNIAHESVLNNAKCKMNAEDAVNRGRPVSASDLKTKEPSRQERKRVEKLVKQDSLDKSIQVILGLPRSASTGKMLCESTQTSPSISRHASTMNVQAVVHHRTRTKSQATQTKTREVSLPPEMVDKKLEAAALRKLPNKPGIPKSMSTGKLALSRPPSTACSSASKPLELRKIKLIHCEGEDLGFCIRGGKEVRSGIYVSDVDVGGQAERQGLRTGDRILKVNEASYRSISHDDAVNTIRNGSRITMFVTDAFGNRMPQGRKTLMTMSPKKPQGNIRFVVLKADSDGWLGCSIKGGTDYGMHPMISNVEKGSPAYKIGLKTGDLIVKLNDVDVSSMTHIQIVTLATASRELRLLIHPMEKPLLQADARQSGSVTPVPSPDHRANNHNSEGRSQESQHHSQNHQENGHDSPSSLVDEKDSVTPVPEVQTFHESKIKETESHQGESSSKSIPKTSAHKTENKGNVPEHHPKQITKHGKQREHSQSVITNQPQPAHRDSRLEYLGKESAHSSDSDFAVTESKTNTHNEKVENKIIHSKSAGKYEKKDSKDSEKTPESHKHEKEHVVHKKGVTMHTENSEQTSQSKQEHLQKFLETQDPFLTPAEISVHEKCFNDQVPTSNLNNCVSNIHQTNDYSMKVQSNSAQSTKTNIETSHREGSLEGLDRIPMDRIVSDRDSRDSGFDSSNMREAKNDSRDWAESQRIPEERIYEHEYIKQKSNLSEHQTSSSFYEPREKLKDSYIGHLAERELLNCEPSYEREPWERRAVNSHLSPRIYNSPKHRIMLEPRYDDMLISRQFESPSYGYGNEQYPRHFKTRSDSYYSLRHPRDYDIHNIVPSSYGSPVHQRAYELSRVRPECSLSEFDLRREPDYLRYASGYSLNERLLDSSLERNKFNPALERTAYRHETVPYNNPHRVHVDERDHSRLPSVRYTGDPFIEKRFIEPYNRAFENSYDDHRESQYVVHDGHESTGPITDQPVSYISRSDYLGAATRWDPYESVPLPYRVPHKYDRDNLYDERFPRSQSGPFRDLENFHESSTRRNFNLQPKSNIDMETGRYNREIHAKSSTLPLPSSHHYNRAFYNQDVAPSFSDNHSSSRDEMSGRSQSRPRKRRDSFSSWATVSTQTDKSEGKSSKSKNLSSNKQKAKREEISSSEKDGKAPVSVNIKKQKTNTETNQAGSEIVSTASGISNRVRRKSWLDGAKPVKIDEDRYRTEDALSERYELVRAGSLRSRSNPLCGIHEGKSLSNVHPKRRSFNRSEQDLRGLKYHDGHLANKILSSEDIRSNMYRDDDYCSDILAFPNQAMKERHHEKWRPVHGNDDFADEDDDDNDEDDDEGEELISEDAIRVVEEFGESHDNKNLLYTRGVNNKKSSISPESTGYNEDVEEQETSDTEKAEINSEIGTSHKRSTSYYDD